jgi:cell division protein FtsI/penicillin-binding protein 2
LVWVGFFLGQGGNLWIVAVAPLVAGAVAWAASLLRRWHARHRGTGVMPAALAVVLTTAVLVELGLLLVVRLEVVPDPDPVLGDVIGPGAWAEFRATVLQPMAALAALFLVVQVGLRSTGLFRRLSSWLTRLPVWALLGGGFLGVVGLFLLPYAGSPDRLTFAGVATPEYGKILFLAVLTGVLVLYSVDAERHRSRTPRFRESLRALVTRRDILWPVLLFAAAAGRSAGRWVLGPRGRLGVAPAAVILLVLWTESAPSGQFRLLPRVLHRLRSLGRVATPYLLPLGLLVLVAGAVAVSTGYVSERFSVAGDPWRYSWTPACVEPVETAASPADVPDGTVACQESLASHVESRRSQLAEGLAVIADGGVWGRGLGDTASRGLPAGSTDFVLAVAWSKLGGLVVLGICAVVVLLGTALVRTARPSVRPGGYVAPAQVLAVATAALLVGQFSFVLAATLGWVPHSGITVPFLSRGGQSTAALLAGVVAAVVVSCLAAAAARRHRWGASPWSVGTGRGGGAFVVTGLVLALCAGAVAHVVVVPYGGHAEDRPACRAGATGIDPEVCSTDEIALARTSLAVEFAAGGGYRFDRTTQRWLPLAEDIPAVAEMAGLLGNGGDAGVLDLAYQEVLTGSAGTTLAGRLLPSRFRDGGVDGGVTLTIDPALQAAAGAELAAPGPQGEGPLAGGVVLLDAASGEVLAAATAPTAPPPRSGGSGTSLRAARDAFDDDHGFGPRSADGNIAEGSGNCPLGQPTTAELAECWRWSLAEASPGDDPGARPHLLEYVGEDADVDLPGTDENRALGRRYGLGSTFKVVVAAAYLRQDGTSAADRIEAPLRAVIGSGEIRNAGGGACAGSAGGTMTLTQALAVSCNTAFVRLAQQVGWPSVRDTAADLGFLVDDAESPAPARVAGLPLGASSVVPEEAAGAELANAVLGGGAVAGTPLQMAAVLAAVANGGRAVTPSLVASVTAPGTGRPEPVVVPEAAQVLTPEQARELATALSRTTSDGTATDLAVPSGHTSYVKTGTHELYAGRPVPAAAYARFTSWMVGFIDTAEGPVSFACALEARDEAEGAARVRQVVERLLQHAVEERG